MNRSAIPLTQLTKKPAQISKTIDCIIPAAGLSSRMGQWKMMLPWQHGTILDASIKNALALCSHIILVFGYRAEELMARYQQHPAISLIYHADYQQGYSARLEPALRLLIVTTALLPTVICLV